MANQHEHDPVELLHKIRQSQAALVSLSSEGSLPQEQQIGLDEFLSQLPELWKKGEARPTQEPNTKGRTNCRRTAAISLAAMLLINQQRKIASANEHESTLKGIEAERQCQEAERQRDVAKRCEAKSQTVEIRRVAPHLERQSGSIHRGRATLR